MKKFAILLLLALAISQTDLFAQFRKFDPRLRWQTLETSHFAIHFHQGEDELAREVATRAEIVYQKLAEIFDYQPSRKTQIVIDDVFDLPFDAATPLPYNTIFLNPTQIHLRLGHYDDWLNLVITHELVHTLDLDRTEGIAKILRRFIGRLYFPNAFGPQWLTEGLATYFETELTSGGRGIDPYHDMILRMAFLEDNVNEPDQNNVFLDKWPTVISPYVYGESLYRYLAENYGQRAVIKFRKEYAGNLVPYRISASLDDAIQKDLTDLYMEWKRASKERYAKQVELINSKGLTHSRRLTQTGYETWTPVWDKTGATIYTVTTNAWEHQAIKAIDFRTGEVDKIKTLNSIEPQLSYDFHSTSLAFSQLEFNRGYNLYNDLWLMNLGEQKAQRLTHGLRAKDPAWDPSGKRIVFVARKLGKTSLLIYDLTNQSIETLIPFENYRQFSEPQWSPNGGQIALSVWENGGYQDIWTLDLQTMQMAPLLRDRAWDISPTWSRDGRFVIFSSDRTGVFNLFAYEIKTGKLRQLTNVLGGAFDPAVSPNNDQIAFVNYSSAGFDIHVMNWSGRELAAIESSEGWGQSVSDSSLFVYGFSDSVHTAVMRDSLSKERPIEMTITAYNPLKTLRPTFFFPFFSSTDIETEIGAATFGQDVLGKHTYSLLLMYKIENATPGYSLSYVNNQFYPSVLMSLSDLTTFRTEDVVDRNGETVDYWEHRKEVLIQLRIPFIQVDRFGLFTFGLRRLHFSNFGQTIQPESSPYFQGTLGSFLVGLNFSNARKYRTSISSIEGFDLLLEYENFVQALDSDLAFGEFRGDIRKFWKIPGTQDHVLSFHLTGAVNNNSLPLLLGDFNRYSIRGFRKLDWIRNIFLFRGEFRFPLKEIQTSTPIIPLFVKRIHGGLFADGANYRAFDGKRLKRASLGLTVNSDLAMGYLVDVTAEVGLAIPVMPHASPEFFLSLLSNF